MKQKLFIIIVLAFISISHSNGQIEISSKIYHKELIEGVELLDVNNKPISKEDKFNLFYKVDTVINCFGPISNHYLENQYLPLYYFIITIPKTIDSLESNSFNSYVDYYVLFYDEDTGKYKYKEKVFRIKREIVKGLNKPIFYNSSINDDKLITKENEIWVIQQILIENENVLLDECHRKYQLRFPNKESYTQSYLGKSNCKTILTKEALKGFVYPETDGITKHEIILEEGKWKTRKKELSLVNKKEDFFNIVKYSFEHDVLVLEYEPNHLIRLKKRKVPLSICN